MHGEESAITRLTAHVACGLKSSLRPGVTEQHKFTASEQSNRPGVTEQHTFTASEQSN